MKGAPKGVQRADQRAVRERVVRWSARRKEGVVIRSPRDESLDLVARESGQPAGRIAGRREEFLVAGHEGLNAFRYRSQPGLRLRVQDQRLRGEVHQGIEGAGALDRVLRHL